MSLNGVCRKSEFQTSARPYAILIFPEPGTQNPERANEEVLSQTTKIGPIWADLER